MAESTELRTGSTVELSHAYRIESLVDSTRVANLYLARWELFGFSVYVRSYASLPRLRVGTMHQIRFRNDIARCGRVRSPRLPDIIDVGEVSTPHPFLVMRLPPGRMLESVVRVGATMTPEQTAVIVEDIARALTDCRAQGLVHRGPTPDRIWLDDDGHATLLGLGEVLYRDESSSMSTPPASDLLWHLPPECFAASIDSPSGKFRRTDRGTSREAENRELRELELSSAAEVYALGCLAYFCLAGYHPFFIDRDDPSNGISATLQDLPGAIDNPLVTSEIFEVLGRALFRAPEDRYPTPLELAAAFRHAIDGPDELDEGEDEPDSPVEETYRELTTTAGMPSLERRGRPWGWMFFSSFCLAALVGVLIRDRLLPVTLVVTSNPPGLSIAEMVGHLPEDRGRTPILLRDRAPDAPIRLRSRTTDGEMGEAREFAPREFEDLGRCRLLPVVLEDPE